MVGTATLSPIGRLLEALNSQQTMASLLNGIPQSSASLTNWRVSWHAPVRPSRGLNYYGRTRLTARRSRICASASDEIGLNSLIQDLDMPEIDADLSDRQAEQGALFGVWVLHMQLHLRTSYT
jgi:hypothetical protein